jgi:hypothetical protein
MFCSDIFNTHVFDCSKVGLPVQFTIPSADGVIQTLEARQNYLGRTAANRDNFHVLVSSPATPPYPVLASEFIFKYSIFDVNGESERSAISDINLLCNPELHQGTAVPRSLHVKVLRAPVCGSLATSWGSVLPFTTDSFILRYRENDFAVIDMAVFDKTYRIHPEILVHFVEYYTETGDRMLYMVTYDGTKSLEEIEQDILNQLSEKTGFDIYGMQLIVAEYFLFGDLKCPPTSSYGDVLSTFEFLRMVFFSV